MQYRRLKLVQYVSQKGAIFKNSGGSSRHFKQKNFHILLAVQHIIKLNKILNYITSA